MVEETRRTGSYPMRGSDHMITTVLIRLPEWPGLKGSKHSVTSGAQLMIYLMWMCRVLFQTFKQFWHIWPGDLELWPQINRVLLLARTDVWSKFEEGRSRSSRVIDRKQFWHIWQWWPLTQWPQNGQSMKKVGQGVLELLIGNEKVTDGQTDICKAICPLFFEVRHNNYKCGYNFTNLLYSGMICW